MSWYSRSGWHPDPPTCPCDADCYLAVDAGREADQLLEGEAFEPSAVEIRCVWLVDTEPAGKHELSRSLHSIEDCAGELLFEGWDGVGSTSHAGNVAPEMDQGITLFARWRPVGACLGTCPHMECCAAALMPVLAYVRLPHAPVSATPHPGGRTSTTGARSS